MDIETSNFDNFSPDEYIDNLIRLGALNHTSLVGENVYYSKKIYGVHKIIKWDVDKAEYLLDLDGQKFWTNPFRIYIIT